MPELPEVETVRLDLEREVVGRCILSAWARPPDGLSPMILPDPEAFVAATRGARVLAATRYGKQLDLPLDTGWHLLAHLGMTGRLTIQRAEPGPSFPPADRHVWAALTMEPGWLGGDVLIFRDPRRLGVLEVTQSPRFRERLGVDPFDPAFDPEMVAEAIARRHAPIKMVLLDQRIVAGLGSIYADELCFIAGVYPTTPASDVPRDRLAMIVREMRPLLERAIAARGATIDGSPYRDLFGVAEEFRPQAYGRGGKPCPRCGTTMERARVGGGQRGRSYTYCPACQPAPQL